jgi:hypothetical protein
MSKDLVNLGVDLRIIQLLGEGMAGTTWPQIHPDGHLLLTERLNPAAEKGLCPSALCIVTIE